MNLARQSPALYATLLEQRRQNYCGGDSVVSKVDTSGPRP
jgi:hypothetical protein